MQKKNLLVTFTLLVATVWLQAQITVTNATFPAAGDTFKIASDFAPNGISITGAGGPFTWDYSSLNPVDRQVFVFQPASAGSAFANFPNAELVTISDTDGETYYDLSATAFAILGLSGSDIGGGFPFATDLTFTPPLTEQHAPLTFPSVFIDTTSFGFAISTDAIPSEILDSLGVPSGLLDSIRLRITIHRSDFVDAYGTVAIPGGTYNVLREKRTDITDTRLEVHVPFLGWQDVTDLVPFGGFGTETTLTYNFISNTAKEPIAVLTMDTTGLIVEQVDYKDNGIASAVDPVSPDKTKVIVSPNPVLNQATFELKNIETGRNTLRLFDANGDLVFEKEITTSNESVSLESLPGGLYVYQVCNAKNKIQATGKLVKAN